MTGSFWLDLLIGVAAMLLVTWLVLLVGLALLRPKDSLGIYVGLTVCIR